MSRIHILRRTTLSKDPRRHCHQQCFAVTGILAEDVEGFFTDYICSALRRKNGPNGGHMSIPCEYDGSLKGQRATSDRTVNNSNS